MVEVRRSAQIHVMVEAAQKAGRTLMRDFGEVENLQVSRKGPADFVSTADRKSEKVLHAMLEKARPKYGFLMEESGEIKGEDEHYRWIIDPLDGTTNFLHSVPHFCISIALEKDKEIIAGVIYDPVKDDTFTAEKGIGAFHNNRRMEVSKRSVMADCLIAVHPYHNQVSMVSQIIAQSTVRTLGSACLDLAYVAAGKMDGFFFEHQLSPWDIAAGALMVKEARGRVSAADGGKDYVYGQGVIAGNPSVHAALLEITKAKSAKAKSAS